MNPSVYHDNVGKRCNLFTQTSQVLHVHFSRMINSLFIELKQVFGWDKWEVLMDKVTGWSNNKLQYKLELNIVI